LSYYAVLLDTESIQQYIYSSNRLKDNLGASHLVKNIYLKPLISSLAEVFEGEDFAKHYEKWLEKCQKWLKDPKRIEIFEDDQCQVEVGYIGGGNALLFFREEIRANEFMKKWSLNLLLNYPGLQTAAAVRELPADYFNSTDAFKNSKGTLFKSLAENKSFYHPTTVIPKHGITADCRDSGFSADVYKEMADDDSRYISVVAERKKDAAEQAAKEINEQYKALLGNEYTFTSRLDQLGQISGDSYLAVVHIDGNSMAKRFQDTPDLPSLRELSASVQKATEEAFTKLLEHIIKDQMPILEKNGSGFAIARDGGKKVIPLRYIVLGGDDITFVTDGRLGVYFAEKFIEYFTGVKVADDKSIAACAGVAIVKTKYPFFRAYELAEELCKNAKKEARKHGVETSWLDFHIAYGGFSGTLETIRKKHFTVGDSSLLFGPYLLKGDPQKVQHGNIYHNLKQGMQYLAKNWPRSKRKDLRLALSLGPDASFKLADFRARDLKLPALKQASKAGGSESDQPEGWVKINGEVGGNESSFKTPYFDMVELMEFFPAHCLEDKEATGVEAEVPEGGAGNE
jgi:hypothetical protein